MTVFFLFFWGGGVSQNNQVETPKVLWHITNAHICFVEHDNDGG